MTSIPFPDLPDEDAAYEDQRAKDDWEECERELRCEQAYFGLCWPRYCKACGGWGVFRWEEKHDKGYPGEPMQEPCDKCSNNFSDNEGYAACGRCHWPLENAPSGDAVGPCENCGWNYDDDFPCY